MLSPHFTHLNNISEHVEDAANKIKEAIFGAASDIEESMWVLDGPDIGGLTSLQYNEMLAGIVYGIIDKNDATQIEACIADGKTEAVLGFTAFTELLSGHFITAFTTLGHVVLALPALLGDCTTI